MVAEHKLAECRQPAIQDAGIHRDRTVRLASIEVSFSIRAAPPASPRKNGTSTPADVAAITKTAAAIRDTTKTTEPNSPPRARKEQRPHSRLVNSDIVGRSEVSTPKEVDGRMFVAEDA